MSTQQHLDLTFTPSYALCLTWVSPFTGEEIHVFGRSVEEAQRAIRMRVIRELTANGKVLILSTENSTHEPGTR